MDILCVLIALNKVYYVGVDLIFVCHWIKRQSGRLPIRLSEFGPANHRKQTDTLNKRTLCYAIS